VPKIGETFMVGGGKQFRIVAKGENLEELEELYERGIHGLWIVESVSAERVARWLAWS